MCFISINVLLQTVKFTFFASKLYFTILRLLENLSYYKAELFKKQRGTVILKTISNTPIRMSINFLLKLYKLFILFYFSRFELKMLLCPMKYMFSLFYTNRYLQHIFIQKSFFSSNNPLLENMLHFEIQVFEKEFIKSL